MIWKLTKKRYYQAPIVKDGRSVLFETEENSQVIAKYLESKLNLGLFPRTWDGIQKILWRYIENDVEGLTFRLNDAYFHEFVPTVEQWAYVRHKERKFGKGCLDQWFQQQKQLVAELNEKLVTATDDEAKKTVREELIANFKDFSKENLKRELRPMVWEFRQNSQPLPKLRSGKIDKKQL